MSEPNPTPANPAGSPPPPYPEEEVPREPEVNRSRRVSLPLDILGRERDKFRYPHTLLVSSTTTSSIISSSDGTSSTPAIIHYWGTGDNPKLSFTSVTVASKLDSLQLVDGFTELGTFTLPMASDAEANQVGECISSLVGKGPDADGQFSLPNADDVEMSDLIAFIESSLSTMADPPENPVQVRICTMNVLSRNPDTPFEAGSTLAWKWSKPTSIYRQVGMWGLDLSSVIEDGEWNAGRGFSVLVREMTEGDLEKMKDHGVVMLG